MTASALLRRQPKTLARALLHVLLEPTGWFAVWFGLDQLKDYFCMSDGLRRAQWRTILPSGPSGRDDIVRSRKGQT
jgi:hypothetical protein